MEVLRGFVEKSEGRYDAKFALSEVAPGLKPVSSLSGLRFIDIDNSVREGGGSDLAYDFDVLYQEGLIEPIHLDHKQSSGGGMIYSNPGIKVTPAGFEAVSEGQKTWLAKSIDKQPITFLQVIVTIVLALITGVLGWLVGNYSCL